MHNRGISLHLLHKQGNLNQALLLESCTFLRVHGWVPSSDTAPGVSVNALLGVDLRFGNCQNDGGYGPLFSQLAYTSKCIFLMRMVPLPIRYDHYVNRTPGQLTKLMHLIPLVHIYV